MATNVKSPKDKTKPARLMPRPTAASAARAAQNAKNRNLTTVQPGIREYNLSYARPTVSPNRKITRQPDNKKLENPTDVSMYEAPDRFAIQDNTNIMQAPDRFAIQDNTNIMQAPDRFAIQDNTLNSTHLQENADLVITAADFVQGENESYNICTIDINNSRENLQPDNEPQNSEGVQPEETVNVQNDEPDQAQNIEAPEVSDNSELVRTPTPQSRPITPNISSRPITPKSRPQTPSRPMTPALPTSRASSRPTTPSTVTSPLSPCKPSPANPQTTPQIPVSYGSRSLTSSIPIATAVTRTLSPKTAHTVCPPLKEDIKAVFATKQKQFHNLKKELDIKQQAVLDLFDNLRNLNERLVKEGCGEGVQFQELVMFNVGDWTSEEITQLCRNTAVSNNENATDFIGSLKHIDEDALSALDAQVSSIPTKFAELCLQAFTARQEMIDWIKEFVEPMLDGRGESMERIARYNSDGIELCDTLRKLKAHADEAVVTIAQIARCALRERSTLLTVGESLLRETASLRLDLEAQAEILNELREVRAEKDTASDLKEMRKQLEEERAARVAAKEKQAATESQLRQTRLRVSKMDRQLKEAEVTIVSLTASVKALEDQSHQREVQFEARARKLKESLKTGEVSHNQIAQQRDALQAEVNSLREQVATLMSTNKTKLRDYIKEIKELKASLENQRQETEKYIEKNKELEQNLAESLAMIDALKDKQPEPKENSSELPTEKEIEIWSELQATKEILQVTEDEVAACKREKVRFLETLTKISESENKIGMQQKLAAELLSKEEIIGKMQIQIRELTKNIKLYEQKVAHYEQFVRDLRTHNQVATDNNDNTKELRYEDWQQEIMNLKMSLLDAVHMNEKLTEVLSQKEQQLEQQDKTSRAQARIIKVREELINMLKNKETEQSRELSALQQDLEQRMKIVDEVNKQIAAKAEEIQELFATLENKQQQIHRLEKIVLALEEQQRRAQAQRMRHEEKIAALEHELAATNRRDRWGDRTVDKLDLGFENEA